MTAASRKGTVHIQRPSLSPPAINVFFPVFIRPHRIYIHHAHIATHPFPSKPRKKEFQATKFPSSAMAMAVATSSAIATAFTTPKRGGFDLATSRQSKNATARLPQFNGLRMCHKRQITARKTWKPRALGSPSLKIFAIVAAAETLETVQDVIAKQLSIELETVKPDTKFADLGADSLDTVEIMMALEEKFCISIGEGGAENIATVQDAADLIEKTKAEGA